MKWWRGGRKDRKMERWREADEIKKDEAEGRTMKKIWDKAEERSRRED
jgi:hypothetical protein